MSCFKEIRSLNNDKETLSLLQKAAYELNPLLERRKWKVDLLTEFIPNDKRLLGLNIKEDERVTIKIRCRTLNKELCTYSCIFHTLLHELTHITCGPHDAAFYALLESLTKETKGYKLNSTTYRVGNCSRDDLREKMAIAAERRMFSIAPRTLGSISSSNNSNVSLSTNFYLGTDKMADFSSPLKNANLSKTMTAREAAGLAAIMRASVNETKK